LSSAGVTTGVVVAPNGLTVGTVGGPQGFCLVLLNERSQ
jgi:hypothetical protein